MDFKGQQLAESLCMYIVGGFACVAFVLGYLGQSFGGMMTVFTGGVALAALITVPNWSVYNRNPVTWLPPKGQQQQQKRGGGGNGGNSSGQKSKNKAASWSNLWGAF